MPATNPILDFLLLAEKKHGRSEVRRAVKKYLSNKSRIAEKGNMRQHISRNWVYDAWLQQNGICGRCGNELRWDSDAVGDHIVPIRRGGQHTRTNVQALHRSCNSSKADKSLMDESKATGKSVAEIMRGGK